MIQLEPNVLRAFAIVVGGIVMCCWFIVIYLTFRERYKIKKGMPCHKNNFLWVGTERFRVVKTFTLTSWFDIQDALDKGLIVREESPNDPPNVPK